MRRVLSNPIVLLTCVALFWGGNAIAGKLAVGHVSPMLLTTLRWLFAVVFIAPFALVKVREQWQIIRENMLMLFLFGAFGFAGFNALFYHALNYTSAINVTIEQSIMPLIVFFGNFLLFKLKPSALQLVGFSLTLFGVAITVSHGDLSRLLLLNLNRGDALMMLAALLYGAYTVTLRYKPALHWQAMIFVLAVSALLSSLLLAYFEYQSGKMLFPDLHGMGVVLYIAIFPSLLAQSLYIRGVEMVGGNRANLFINLVPVFGSILAVLILGEVLHAYHIVALLLVVAGILLAERSAMMRPEVG
ncbi:DMT family transporter [Zhongshania sp. CAU 1632]|uniref:DMT family transporter n=1 Tax=Zhongshania aquimaris TaxID=2857107 RepID=A0ABS6VRT3_9GAMM|nr:DMT family transporter [Zhongshania aquimaris]